MTRPREFTGAAGVVAGASAGDWVAVIAVRELPMGSEALAGRVDRAPHRAGRVDPLLVATCTTYAGVRRRNEPDATNGGTRATSGGAGATCRSATDAARSRVTVRRGFRRLAVIA
ncbi:hypothetical protein GCM10009573_08920 [Agromyces bracchium]